MDAERDTPTHQITIGAITMSPTITAIAKSIIAAQTILEPVKKNKVAPVPGRKDYHYGDLPAMLESILPAFNSQGIAVIQGEDIVEDGLRVTTMLLHSSGEWIASSLAMPYGDGKPQTIGSSATYARRYSIQALCGVCAEDADDDGAKAQSTHVPRTQRPAPSTRLAPPRQPTPATDSAKARLGTELREVAALISQAEGDDPPHWRVLAGRASGVTPWPDAPTGEQVDRAIEGLARMRAEIREPGDDDSEPFPGAGRGR